MSTKRLDQLTFTRFWALLLVIYYHGGGGVYFSWINTFPFSSILQSAPSAVSYLYVLSGFVMSIVYYQPNEKFDVLKYWTTRFVRIYPLYIISFLLVCYYYLDYMARIKPLKILVNIFVLQAWWPPYAQSFNYVSWSLTVEFFFYAVFPFFTMWAYHVSTKKLIWISLALYASTQIIHFILWIGYFPAWESLLVYDPLFHLNSFIGGVVGGIWFLREEHNKTVNQKLNFSLVLMSLGLICGYIIASEVFQQLPHHLEPISGLLSPFFVLFIITLSLDKTGLSRIFSHRWLVTLGETSYALYILQVPVYWIYERALFSSNIGNPNDVLSITYLPLMISVGLAVYFYVDPPIRNWLKRILLRVSMPLLILDLAIYSISIVISFRLRFGDGREYLAYRTTGLLMFWSAFILRTVISVALNGVNSTYLYSSPIFLIGQALGSVTAGSLVVSGLVFLGYRVGWIENFPRSIFLIDWFLVLIMTILVRYLFRYLRIYKHEAEAA
jgi:peptidoglycan/LPS O-acetylase OafA/YrhL